MLFVVEIYAIIIVGINKKKFKKCCKFPEASDRKQNLHMLER